MVMFAAGREVGRVLIVRSGRCEGQVEPVEALGELGPSTLVAATNCSAHY